MSIVELDLNLPRHAFAPGETARAGDLWRLLQEAAVLGSSARGWTPERYRTEGAAFVVRAMTTTHHQPARFGDALRAETWVSSLRREMFTTREIRVRGPRGLVVSTTQSWVHVSAPSLKPSRACASLIDALPVVEREPPVEMPTLAAAAGPKRTFSFDAWHTWMDPLAHANHPAYIDWIDEALSRQVAEAGLDPQQMRPRAETLTFRSGVVAPERVTVVTQLVGADGDDALIAATILANGRLCAEGFVVRGGGVSSAWR